MKGVLVVGLQNPSAKQQGRVCPSIIIASSLSSYVSSISETSNRQLTMLILNCRDVEFLCTFIADAHSCGVLDSDF